MPGPPRKLLFVINSLTLSGGAESQLGHLANGLADLGHNITICCIDNSSIDVRRALMKRGVKVVQLGRRTRASRARAVPHLTRLALQADIVHCTMWDPSLWGRIAAIIARRPSIVADHATDRAVQVSSKGSPRAKWIALHNRLLDRFTFATVACAASQRRVLIDEGVSAEKIVHIPNGIPIDKFVRSAVGGPTRKELGLPDEAPIAMQVGIFRTEKNHLGALESFARVREQLPDVHLVLVGDGPTRIDVERRAKEMGGVDWIHFLGLRDDVPALLSLADIMILPSVSDAMPMAVIEAMALGVPVVATDVGDVRIMLGDAGVCVPAGDDRSFAQACAHLLTESDARARMGEVGIGRARNFDSAVMSRRYAALFDAACTGKPPLAAIPGPAY